MVITGISRVINQLQIPPRQEKDPPGETVASLRTPHFILWDPVGSEFFFFFEDCETFFNLTGGIYPETTRLIQDGSIPSLFREREIYHLSILENDLWQAVLVL